MVLRSSCLLSPRLRWLGAGVGLGVLLAALFPLDRVTAREDEKDCSTVRFSGEVVKDQLFEREVGRGLLFRLNPNRASNPPGWTIELRSLANPENDFLWVATPPYRFMNPRYLDTSYGYSAQEAVQMSERPFNFVLNAADYQKMTEAVRTLLWSYGHSEAELAEARKVVEETQTGSGSLRILHARVGVERVGDERGWIESLKFEVELCLPADVPLAGGATPQRDISEASLYRALVEKFLRMYPAYTSMEDACPDSAEPISIFETQYAELDGRPGEEVVVEAATCFAGTGGVDLPAVFTAAENGELVELAVQRPERNQPFRGRDVWANLHGKLRLAVEGSDLVEIYPVYAAGDPNCCPSAGIRKFIYRWEGDKFVLRRVIDLAPEKE